MCIYSVFLLYIYRIPVSKERKVTRKQWITRLRHVRANLILSDATRLCDAHFKPEDFDDGGTLRAFAVPTVFPSKPVRCEPPSRSNPLAKKRRTDTVEEEALEPMMVEPDDSPPSSLECTQDDATDPTSKGTQTAEVSSTKFAACKVCATTRDEVKDFSCQTNLPDIHPSDLRHDDKKTRFFTGFLNFGTFLVFFNALVKHGKNRLNYWDGEGSLTEKKYHTDTRCNKPGPSRQLSSILEFFMTMMWYRLGLLEEHLSIIFKVSTSTVSRTLITWTQFIYEHSVSLVSLPTREQVLLNLPIHFINHSNVFMVLDCTEFYMEKPSGLEAQCVTWSEYKHHNTIKCLIGCTPDGLTTFISNAYGGRASDRHIVEKEEVLSLIPDGMAVMADKGFEVHDLVPDGVEIIIPPKVSTKEQMSNSNFYKTLDVAEARIVVEMKMEQAKNFRILQTTFPVSRIPTAQQIIHNCFSFTNLLPSLLAPATNPEDTIELPLYHTV